VAVLFLAFGVVSVAFNLYFERRRKRRAAAPVPASAGGG
jgi:hypothetical protein